MRTVELTPQTVPALWDRFDAFHDGVIREIEIQAADKMARVEFDAEDMSAVGTWHRLRFEFEDVREWRFEQIRSDMVVIYAARAAEANGLMFVSFDAATMPEQPGADDFRATCAFIASRTVEWSSSPL
jgi:hypothetical protein